MKNFACCLWCLLLVLLFASGCSPAQINSPTPTPTVVLLNITPAARWVSPAIAACDAANPEFHVEIEERFASHSKADLLVRLGVPAENPGFLAQIANDEIVVVLHPENPVASLTPAEIQALFTGQVSNWAEYDGNDAAVQVWVPLAADETRIAFDSQTLQSLPVLSDAKLAPDPTSMQQTISTNPDSIGYMPASWQPSGLQSIILGLKLPVLVSADQSPVGPAADLVACLQSEIGQQALQEFFP